MSLELFLVYSFHLFLLSCFKKWLSPYSYIFHCFLFSDSANMQNLYPLFQFFISYPYHPLSDFFKGRAVAAEIDLSSSLSFWSRGFWIHLSTKMLAFVVTDGQVQWPFLAAFLPWSLCDIYYVAQHFLIQVSLASGSLGPLPSSFHHPICSSFCLDSVFGFPIYLMSYILFQVLFFIPPPISFLSYPFLKIDSILIVCWTFAKCLFFRS